MTAVRRLLPTLLAVGALAGSSVTAASTRLTSRPDACALLKAALHGTILGAHAIDRAPGSSRVNCEYEDHEPGPDREWWAHFNGLLPERSAAWAHADWETNWLGWRGTSGDGLSVYRLHGFGADEAFAVEKLESEPPASNTMLWWRKGSHYGLLEIGGRKNLADVEAAEDLLKELLAAVPRT